jgi:hypothetical protein
MIDLGYSLHSKLEDLAGLFEEQIMRDSSHQPESVMPTSIFWTDLLTDDAGSESVLPFLVSCMRAVLRSCTRVMLSLCLPGTHKTKILITALLERLRAVHTYARARPSINEILLMEWIVVRSGSTRLV